MTDVSKTKIFLGFLEEFRGDTLGVADMLVKHIDLANAATEAANAPGGGAIVVIDLPLALPADPHGA